MNPYVENALFAYRANIAKYQRLLATYLTEDERRFVIRRLGEERAALNELAKNSTPSRVLTKVE